MDLTDLWRDVERVFAAETSTMTPAASVGVLSGDVSDQRSFGVADVGASRENNPETLFEIGSITKPWTATVVLRCWERGLLDLDAPMREVVPDFALAEGAGAAITARHLLSHTSGLANDTYDIAAGASIDNLLRYLRSTAPQRPAGSSWQYSNLGYVILGRLIEAVIGQPYSQAMRTELLDVLDCPTASIAGETALPAPRAVGYAISEGSTTQVVQAPTQYRGYAPAGSTPAANARDVLKFVAAHLNDGSTGSGRLLHAETVRLMRRPVVSIHDDPAGRIAWGLGWGFWRIKDQVVIGHGGSTPGFSSTLMIHPHQPTAVIVLTNSASASTAMMRLAQLAYDGLALHRG